MKCRGMLPGDRPPATRRHRFFVSHVRHCIIYFYRRGPYKNQS